MSGMRVILTEEVPKLGDAGDVVTVKAGYGRNYLLPQGKAMLATERRVKELEHKRRIIEEREKKNVKDLEGKASSLAAVDLSFEMQASQEGKLFGSVTNSDIAGRFAEQGIKVDRRKIVLGEPIKSVGEHDVTVRLHREVSVPVKVTVVSIGAPPAEEVDRDLIDETALPEPTED
jgi:large subunit ribosomal protein L9